MRRFLDKLTSEVHSTIDQAGNWSGYASPGPVFGHRPGPGGIPQTTTPCPRQVPQPGHADWIGLGDAQFAAFNVCPHCYASLIRPTSYVGAFVTKAGAIAPPPHVPVRCDMSRFWVRVAGMVLLTMNANGRHDVSLLARVATMRVQDAECPNAVVGSEQQPLPVVRRTWYTLQDPATGMQPLPGWTLCAACVIALQTCCPDVATAFAPVQPQGERDACCGLVPSDRYDDVRTGLILQQVGACAALVPVSRRVDMTQLLNWLRANPPPQRTGMAPGAGPGLGMAVAAGPGIGPLGVPNTGRITAPVFGSGGGSFAAPTVRGVQAAPPPTPGVAPVHHPWGGSGGGSICPRNTVSTSQKCHTIPVLLDFTVCEQCYAAVVKPDAARGVEFARRIDPTASVLPSGFTCQLYSDRMRRVWADAASTGNFETLRQKVRDGEDLRRGVYCSPC